MTSSPVRSLPSTGVWMNVDACNNNDREHEMQSVKLNSDTVVGYIERCRRCGWIDEKSLQWWVEDAIKRNTSQRAKRIAVAAESQPFQFVQHPDEDLTLEEILFQALGAASMCWEHPEKAGTFDSTRAKAIGEALLREVNRALKQAHDAGQAEGEPVR